MHPGTPFFRYDLDRVRANAARIRGAMPHGVTVAYAMKANPHRRILEVLRSELDRVDVSSLPELERAVEAGWSGEAITFSGPAKTDAAILRAAELGVRITAEALDQIDRIQRVAPAAKVGLRINPSRRFFAYRVAMGGVPSAFGIDEAELDDALVRVRPRGLQVFAGSECSSVGGVMTAVAHTLDVAERIGRATGPLEWVSFGGGLVPGFDVESLGRKLGLALDKFAQATGARPEHGFEVGRFLVEDAGIYVVEVVSIKSSHGARFVVLDGGINHVLFATGRLGNPPHELVNLTNPDGPRVAVHVAGPLCTPLDRFGDGPITLPEPRVGDRLAVLRTGAYGLTASPSDFIGHAPPSEIFEHGKIAPGIP